MFNNKNKKGQIEMNNTKIKFEINSHIQKNKVIMGFSDIVINGVNITKTYEYRVFKDIRRYRREKIVSEIVLYYIDNAIYYEAFNQFKNPEDYQIFAEMFALESISSVTNSVIEFNIAHSLLKCLKFSEKEKKILVDKDDTKKHNLSEVTALIQKHFDVSFNVDYIKK